MCVKLENGIWMGVQSSYMTSILLQAISRKVPMLTLRSLKYILSFRPQRHLEMYRLMLKLAKRVQG